MRVVLKYLLPALCLCAVGCADGAGCGEKPWEGPAADLSRGGLTVSDNGRHLSYRDGTPFVWMGDTAWELFGRLDMDEAVHYLEDRRAKGFTVVQAVILKELDTIGQPNRNGIVALRGTDPLAISEDYLRWVDDVIAIAAEKGLYVGLLPTWGDKVDRQWGRGPVIFDTHNAGAYGRMLGRRYRDAANIVWIIGGDRSGGGDNNAVWNAMAEGIRAEDPDRLMTFHPQGEHSSSMWFADSQWLDFNMFQSGHAQSDYTIFRRLLLPDYAAEPPRPVLDGEPRYENIPINFDSVNGRFTAHDVRMAMYHSLFSGAFGHTYGANEVWQMYSPGLFEPVLEARFPWYEALHLEGAGDIIHARRLLESVDFTSSTPAPELLPYGGDDADMAVAVRGDGFVWVYMPHGNPVEFASGGLRVRSAHWYDPRTGESLRAAKPKRGAPCHRIVPPTSGFGHDWIYILQTK